MLHFALRLSDYYNGKIISHNNKNINFDTAANRKYLLHVHPALSVCVCSHGLKVSQRIIALRSCSFVLNMQHNFILLLHTVHNLVPANQWLFVSSTCCAAACVIFRHTNKHAGFWFQTLRKQILFFFRQCYSKWIILRSLLPDKHILDHHWKKLKDNYDSVFQKYLNKTRPGTVGWHGHVSCCVWNITWKQKGKLWSYFTCEIPNVFYCIDDTILGCSHWNYVCVNLSYFTMWKLL